MPSPRGTRVLLVEDDASLRESVSLGLRRLGFDVQGEADGAKGLRRILSDSFELVLLDVMLPSLDGLSVCREVRQRSQVPIIMLTARDDTLDVVQGLDCGADDYVTKPFELAELAARIRSVMRRYETGDIGVLHAGRAEIDPAAVRVTKDGHEVALSATEFRLLVELAQSRGQVVTREELLRRVWGYDYLGQSRLVDQAIKRLRGKVEDDPGNPTVIETVRGFGYRCTT